MQSPAAGEDGGSGSPGHIEVHVDRYGTDEGQHSLLFVPPGPMADSGVLFVHPGGWSHGSPRVYGHVGAFFAGMGYPTIVAGYRLAPQHRFPAQVHDIFQAYASGRHTLGELGALPDGMVVIGSSSGAHIASFLVYDRSRQRELSVQHSDLRGFISVSGPLNLDVCRNPYLNSLLDDLLVCDGQRNEANPIRLVRGDEGVPVLCIHGEADDIVELDNSVSFVEKVRQHDETLADLYIERGGDHFQLAGGVFSGDRPATVHLRAWLENIGDE